MQAETTQTIDLERAEARLPRWMVAWGALGVAAVLLGGHARSAVGFGLGAGLAILNYQWLHQAIGTLFTQGRSRVPKFVVVKMVLRYPLAFAGVYIFYRTGWLPISAIFAGLFVPVAGALTEAGFQFRAGLGNPN